MIIFVILDPPEGLKWGTGTRNLIGDLKFFKNLRFLKAGSDFDVSRTS